MIGAHGIPWQRRIWGPKSFNQLFKQKLLHTPLVSCIWARRMQNFVPMQLPQSPSCLYLPTQLVSSVCEGTLGILPIRTQVYWDKKDTPLFQSGLKSLDSIFKSCMPAFGSRLRFGPCFVLLALPCSIVFFRGYLGHLATKIVPHLITQIQRVWQTCADPCSRFYHVSKYARSTWPPSPYI